MRALDKLRLRFRSLLRRAKVERELADELHFHLEQLTEENIAAGMTPEEAHMAALRAIGGIAQYQEECRDMRQVNIHEDSWRDLRHAARVLQRATAPIAVDEKNARAWLDRLFPPYDSVEAATGRP